MRRSKRRELELQVIDDGPFLVLRFVVIRSDQICERDSSMPFPNLIAGILIGIACHKWGTRLIIPFAWAVVFCVYSSFFEKSKRDVTIAYKKHLNRKLKWGISPTHAFYFGEYVTATFTSLMFSVLTGTIKGIL